ncbi:SDR family oxidoreductase [Mycolicibacterium stellerae]|uniref:SDR family oxidoreductase n=1 Tax=Mycolicibacterium stellerae TaxID=2358193 RepID=UPI000F0B9C45|nr:SDR family oxidoreductase [Mycolicibacterium stellerae]
MGVLQNKTALVTGGTSGIGLAAARRLAEEGAHVFVTGRSQQRLDEAVAQIGLGATGVVSDVSNFADIDVVVEAIEAHGHELDVVFTNAGGGEFALISDVTVEHYLDTFNRNVGGTLFTVQKVLPLLNRGASIVLAGSTAPSKGMPAFGIYAASKAAVRSLGRTMAAELVDRGIRVNVLVPGPVETPGLTGLAPAGGESELLAEMAASVPMKRVGHVDEIASAVAFLASDASSFMTGSELFVDGGEVQV